MQAGRRTGENIETDLSFNNKKKEIFFVPKMQPRLKIQDFTFCELFSFCESKNVKYEKPTSLIPHTNIAFFSKK